MDKLRPSFPLEEVKAAFSNPCAFRITRSARRDAISLGISDQEISDIVKSLQPKNFYKSMTSYHDHRLWQDVYHVTFDGMKLYLKFCSDAKGIFLLSFKEK